MIGHYGHLGGNLSGCTRDLGLRFGDKERGAPV